MQSFTIKLKRVRTSSDPWHPETCYTHTDNIRSKVWLFRDQEKHNDQDRQHWKQKQQRCKKVLKRTKKIINLLMQWGRQMIKEKELLGPLWERISMYKWWQYWSEFLKRTPPTYQDLVLWTWIELTFFSRLRATCPKTPLTDTRGGCFQYLLLAYYFPLNTVICPANVFARGGPF